MSGTSKAEDSAAENPCVALFMPISAPTIRCIEPLRATRFIKERERYKFNVYGKQAEVRSLQPTLYTAGIERSLLKHVLHMSCFNDIHPGDTAESLTNEQMKDYLVEQVHHINHPQDPVRLREAADGINFLSYITDLNVRIATYYVEIFERLDANGYRGTETENPKYAVK